MPRLKRDVLSQKRHVVGQAPHFNVVREQGRCQCIQRQLGLPMPLDVLTRKCIEKGPLCGTAHVDAQRQHQKHPRFRSLLGH